MARFLNTEATDAAIVSIIAGAQKKVVLISPFIYVPKLLLERLIDKAQKENTKIVVVCRATELKPDIRESLATLPNLELRFLENLHAKCFYNEESMVLGSSNLYEYSLQNNREMGVLLNIKDDSAVFREACKEAEFILRLSKVGASQRSAAKKKSEDSQKSFPPEIIRETGYCIRCGVPRFRDLAHPLCDDCYDEWAEWSNPNYEENFCHVCGREWSTTIEKPLCDSCYRKSQRGR